jgi:hypothetical protein
MICLEWPRERISSTRPGPMLRSLVRVAGVMRWREGCVGDVGGEVKARVGARWDSRVAIRFADVVAVIVSFFLAIGGGLGVGSDRWYGW